MFRPLAVFRVLTLFSHVQSIFDFERLDVRPPCNYTPEYLRSLLSLGIWSQMWPCERTRAKRNHQFAAIVHFSPLIGGHYARICQGRQNDVFVAVL